MSCVKVKNRWPDRHTLDINTLYWQMDINIDYQLYVDASETISLGWINQS